MDSVRLSARWSRPRSWGDAYLDWLPRCAVLLGAVLRIRNWAHDRSLWLDEISIANNIRSRSFAELTHPLAANQAAPIGWLWAERASVMLFGVNENALRLVPLVASLAALALFPLAARTLIGVSAAPVATVLFATSPALIYFAAETKQYSTDVACVLAILVVTAPLMRSEPTVRRGLLWGLVCSALSWCSFPGTVVACVCGLVLLVRCVRRPGAVLALAPGGALLLANVLVQYLVTLRNLSHNAALDVFWQRQRGYPPRPGTLRSELGWIHQASIAVLHAPAQLAFPLLVLLVGAWGLVSTARLHVDTVVLLCVPIVTALGLALAHRYPMSTRLALFILPVILMLLAAGAVGVVTATASVVHRAPTAAWIATVVALGLLIATSGRTMATGVGKLVRPDDVIDGRETIAFVADHRRPTDLVLVEFPWAVTNLNFYGPRYDVRANGTFRFSPRACTGDPLAKLEGRGRVWLVMTHRGSNEPTDRNQVFRSAFETRAPLLLSHYGTGGTAAYLLDFSTRHDRPAPPLRGWPGSGCLQVVVAGEGPPRPTTS